MDTKQLSAVSLVLLLGLTAVAGVATAQVLDNTLDYITDCPSADPACDAAGLIAAVGSDLEALEPEECDPTTWVSTNPTPPSVGVGETSPTDCVDDSGLPTQDDVDAAVQDILDIATGIVTAIAGGVTIVQANVAHDEWLDDAATPVGAPASFGILVEGLFAELVALEVVDPGAVVEAANSCVNSGGVDAETQPPAPTAACAAFGALLFPPTNLPTSPIFSVGASFDGEDVDAVSFDEARGLYIATFTPAALGENLPITAELAVGPVAIPGDEKDISIVDAAACDTSGNVCIVVDDFDAELTLNAGGLSTTPGVYETVFTAVDRNGNSATNGTDRLGAGALTFTGPGVLSLVEDTTPSHTNGITDVYELSITIPDVLKAGEYVLTGSSAGWDDETSSIIIGDAAPVVSGTFADTERTTQDPTGGDMSATVTLSDANWGAYDGALITELASVEFYWSSLGDLGTTSLTFNSVAAQFGTPIDLSQLEDDDGEADFPITISGFHTASVGTHTLNIRAIDLGENEHEISVDFTVLNVAIGLALSDGGNGITNSYNATDDTYESSVVNVAQTGIATVTSLDITIGELRSGANTLPVSQVVVLVDGTPVGQPLVMGVDGFTGTVPVSIATGVDVDVSFIFHLTEGEPIAAGSYAAAYSIAGSAA